ncbi:trypsin-like serine protease [Flavivirga algicola]|uniref:Trypsin-like serine protease n=1 Tax=Flavivirga algicola TaxID=2729136 RepID=A0ABX1RVP3_9FLAO|nr:trypsin-like serine protease [Flavivirga algicola]NMH86512.1 trypsin-like serine protease [Flavivirga algicola]
MDEKDANDLLIEITKGMESIPFISYAAVVENPLHKNYYFIEYGLFEKYRIFQYEHSKKWSIRNKENSGLYTFLKNSNLSDLESDLYDQKPVINLSEMFKKETSYITFPSSGVETLHKEKSKNDKEERIITGGISIGNLNIDDKGGTLGALFYLQKNDKLYAITNSHVVANGDSKINEEIHFPSLIHDLPKLRHHKIGELKKWFHNSKMDVAIVEITNEKKYPLQSGDRICKTPFKGLNTPKKNSLVYKVGYNGKSCGHIRSLNASFRIDSSYNGERKPIIMTNQIMIENIDVGKGDSGSVITNENREVVGVLFARDKEAKRSFFTPINGIFVNEGGNDINKNPPYNFHEFLQ